MSGRVSSSTSAKNIPAGRKTNQPDRRRAKHRQDKTSGRRGRKIRTKCTSVRVEWLSLSNRDVGGQSLEARSSSELLRTTELGATYVPFAPANACAFELPPSLKTAKPIPPSVRLAVSIPLSHGGLHVLYVPNVLVRQKTKQNDTHKVYTNFSGDETAAGTTTKNI